MATTSHKETHSPLPRHLSDTSFLHLSPHLSPFLKAYKDRTGHLTPPLTPSPTPLDLESSLGLKDLPYTWVPVPPLPTPKGSDVVEPPVRRQRAKTIAIAPCQSENHHKDFSKASGESSNEAKCTCTLYPLPTPSSRNYESSLEYFSHDHGSENLQVCEIHSRRNTPSPPASRKVEQHAEDSMRSKGVHNWLNHAGEKEFERAKVSYGAGTDGGRDRGLCRMKREDWKRERHLGVIYGGCHRSFTY